MKGCVILFRAYVHYMQYTEQMQMILEYKVRCYDEFGLEHLFKHFLALCYHQLQYVSYP